MKYIYTVRVVYDCGYTHDFEVTEFKYTDNSAGKKFEWVAFNPNNVPIMLGVSKITAVWQIGVREMTEDESN